MEIKKLDCPSCGATLEVDSNKKSGICKYCKSPYILDDGVIRIEYSFADEEGKRQIANANVTLYKYKNYKKSLYLFMDLFYKYQDNQDFLLGIILSLTHDFTKEKYTLSDIKKIVYYWDLFKRIGKKENIEKYQKDIDKILEQEKTINEENSKRRKIILISVSSVIIVLIIILSLFYFAEPSKKNVTIKLSDLDKKEEKLINTPFLDCEYVDSTVFESKINIKYSCSNFIKNGKNYTFSYDFIDDEKPTIESNNCTVEEKDKPNYKDCLKVSDRVDGEIVDYEVDDQNSNFNEIGNTTIIVKAKDKAGNETSKEINVEVTKINITKIELNISGDVHRVSEKSQSTVVLEPNKLIDKSVKYTSSDPNVATINDKGYIEYKKIGTTNICAISNYDDSFKSCKEVQVYVQCKNTYTIDLDTSKENNIVANYDYCPGTYRIYAPSVLNSDEYYSIKIYYNTSSSTMLFDKSISIWKKTPQLSEEGYKASLGEKSKLEVPAGIKQIRLVKSQ